MFPTLFCAFAHTPALPAHNSDMLTAFVRTLVIYFCLLVILRLMGKKQLGELQPFELAITLVAADLACIPMSDTQVPILYGLVPIFALFIAEFVITRAVKGSVRLRGAINGKPVIVITPDGIDAAALDKLEMTVGDLNEALRGKDVFTPQQVSYAIVETNGDLSVIKNENCEMPTEIPYTLICDGKMMKDNIGKSGFPESAVRDLLDENRLKPKQVLLMTSTGGEDYYIQPRKGKFITGTV